MTTTMNPRPKTSDQNVIEAAAKLLAPQVKEWCDDDTDIAAIERDLAKAMRRHDDGYEIAAQLDRAGYSPNAELVEILDNSFYEKQKALKPLLIEWVASSGNLPPEIGASVLHPTKPKAGIGTVIENHPDGTATVRFPDLGHVEVGVNGTQGFVLPWELLAPSI